MRVVSTPQGVIVRAHTQATDEAAIAAFEASRGFRLPSEYREFLLATNGGKPEPCAFQLALRSGPYTDSIVHWFLGLGDTMAASLESFAALMAGRMPAELLPIAPDPGGNLVCLGVKGDVRGKVYFWDHERERTPADWSNVDLVADSFDAFLRGLTPE